MYILLPTRISSRGLSIDSNHRNLAYIFFAIVSIFSFQNSFASMAEHQAVLDLVPLSAVNRQVVQNGSWSNPATWNGGTLPQAGDNIYIPADKSLSVDIDSNLNYKTIRADGILKFATTKNVSIKLDTLVVTETGTIEIGSETSRVPANIKTTIFVANNGPIDRAWDPLNISRGIILQGKTRIYGSEKTAYQKLSVNPPAGSAQIKLAAVPTGWVPGDVIAITATKFRRKLKTDTSYQTEDELRSIKAISGNVITLGKINNPSLAAPLSFSHVSSIANMPVYAANLTRNVVFSGEGGDAVPASQRGHFMVMHSPDTVIKGASFNYFGRTDKSIPINDFALNDQGFRLTDVNGNYIPDVNTNPRGRYAVHFHHTGTDIKVSPVICSGNAVISSKGWGFVNHTSNVLMENNASFDVYGSHFVSEDGNELGTFKNNIAIKSEGRSTFVKNGLGNHDHGHTGHGFWFHSRNLAVEDNVVSGVYSAGIVYYHRVVIDGINTEIPRENLLTTEKNITKGMPTISYSHVPIIDHKNSTVLASGSALNVIKSNRETGHDVGNIFESLKGYSVIDGVQIQYVEKYTFKNLELAADSNSKQWDHGVNVAVRDRDAVFVNTSVSGFIHPFVTGTTFNGQPDDTDVIFVNTKVDGRPLDPKTDIHALGNEVVYNYNPAFHKIIEPAIDSVDALNLSRPSVKYSLPTRLNEGFSFTGNKSDSLGETKFVSSWDRNSLLSYIQKGYYASPDGGKYVVLPETIWDRFNGQSKTIYSFLKLEQPHSLLGPLLGELKN